MSRVPWGASTTASDNMGRALQVASPAKPVAGLNSR